MTPDAAPVKVIDPPRLTEPPPVNEPLVLIVMAEPLKAEIGILLKVFEEPEMVLLVRV